MAVSLDKLPAGKSGIITRVGGEGALRLHLLDMGLIPKTLVKTYKIAPLGDPVEIHLRGYSLTIRKEDAANITVEESELDADEAAAKRYIENADTSERNTKRKDGDEA